MAWPIRSAPALILLLSFSVGATTLNAYLENAQGVAQFKNKQPMTAYQYFLKALTDDPYSPDLQMNIGNVFEANEEWDKAEKAYLSAVELSKDMEHRFMGLFNLGNVRGKKKDIDGALQAYQACLDMDPNSAEVKTNIELLLQSGGGGGGGGKDKDKDNKDDKKDDKQQNQNPQQDKKPQPKPFQSKDLGKEDVRKILDEIQNQENPIRAKETDKAPKEQTNDKDW